MISLQDLLKGAPPPLPVTPADVRRARGDQARQFVVLDDDPTGTQSVAELPVLNSWSAADLEWALATGAAAVYVMTNSRSLDPAEAAERDREVVRAALAAAHRLGVEIDFVSRSDSTLRGHFPLEPQVIIEELAAAGRPTDATFVVPAFAEAGRITVNSIHYAGSAATGYVPVGETEFARDATFGYRSSDLREWVEEKSGGKIAASNVVAITLEDIRAGADAVAAKLLPLSGERWVVVDMIAEADLSCFALGVQKAQEAGKNYVYRVGPPFVRGIIGQDVLPPLSAEDVASIRRAEPAFGGLVVVGSHVDLTTRQLARLRARQRPAEFEIDVAKVLSDQQPTHLADIVAKVVDALENGNVVVRTSRTLVRGTDGADSLRIARAVSEAVVRVVRRVLDIAPPRFVIGKGGITSSDVASRGLEIGRAIVRGSMLPGIVSLWDPIDGPARGIPYIVFAGNVGNEESLADVVDKLSS
ncbi:MAG: four-carbon acid sugar kinase family protein [Rhodospirillales bacterium]